MARLRTLEVGRYRGLRGGASFAFGPGLHLLVGPAGSGKTELLSLLAMVGRGDFAPTAGEALEVGWSVERERSEGASVVLHGEVSQEAAPAPTAERWQLGMLAAPPTPFRVRMSVEGPEGRILLTGDDRSGWAATLDDGPATPLELGMSLGHPRALSEAWLRAAERLGLRGALRSLAWSALPVCLGRLGPGSGPLRELGGAPLPASECSPGVPHTRIRAGGLALVSGAATAVWGLTGEEGDEGRAPERRVLPDHPTLGPLLAALGATALDVGLVPATATDRGDGRAAADFAGVHFRVWRGEVAVGDPERFPRAWRRLLPLYWTLAAHRSAFVVVDGLAEGLDDDALDATLTALGGRQAFVADHDPRVADRAGLDPGLDRAVILHALDAPGWKARHLTTDEVLRLSQAPGPLSARLRDHGLRSRKPW